MTYCVGMCLQDGVVMLADTRTNAGVDNIAVFSKLHVYENAGERVIGLMTGGNLGVTQSVVSLITEGLANIETGGTDTLMNVPSMFEAARLVGRAIRHVHYMEAAALHAQGVPFDPSFILAGQIRGRRMRMFNIYSAGNFIEASPDTPFMQIGETKYGKPILDRVCTFNTPVWQAVKLAMISMDSTLRSNLSVGMPIDLAVFQRDAARFALHERIAEDHPYFRTIRERWSDALRAAYRDLPASPWEIAATPFVEPGRPALQQQQQQQRRPQQQQEQQQQ